jgi:hypothetical protein
MHFITISIALALLAPLTLALSMTANFEQLPRPLRPATFIGEVNGYAYELNGTVQVSDVLLTFSKPRSSKFKQQIQAAFEKLHPGVQFPQSDITTEHEIISRRNKVSFALRTGCFTIS